MKILCNKLVLNIIYYNTVSWKMCNIKFVLKLHFPIMSAIFGTHLILCRLITMIIFDEYILWNLPLWHLLHLPITSSILGPISPSATLFLNTVSVMFFPYYENSSTTPIQNTKTYNSMYVSLTFWRRIFFSNFSTPCI